MRASRTSAAPALTAHTSVPTGPSCTYHPYKHTYTGQSMPDSTPRTAHAHAGLPDGTVPPTPTERMAILVDAAAARRPVFLMLRSAPELRTVNGARPSAAVPRGSTLDCGRWTQAGRAPLPRASMPDLWPVDRGRPSAALPRGSAPDLSPVDRGRRSAAPARFHARPEAGRAPAPARFHTGTARPDAVDPRDRRCLSARWRCRLPVADHGHRRGAARPRHRHPVADPMHRKHGGGLATSPIQTASRPPPCALSLPLSLSLSASLSLSLALPPADAVTARNFRSRQLFSLSLPLSIFRCIFSL